MFDVHCHLADPRIFQNLDEIVARSIEKGVTGFLQGGVGPDDWKRQKELKNRFPEQIIPCFGLHPYWVSAHTHGECMEARNGH